MRAKTSFEESGKRESIIIHEIPYQVNKGKLLERLGEVAREKIVEDISEIRDESDRDGVRVVIELKINANADVVLNQLFKHTALQTNFRLQHGRALRRPPADHAHQGYGQGLREIPRGGYYSENNI
jgi:DNA gyrase subunit A